MSRIVGAIVLCLLIVSIIFGVNKFAAEHGHDSEKLKQGIEQMKAGEKELARVDTVYKTDTIRLTKEVAKYRVLHDSLRITDTVQVKEFVKQADSTIHACLLTVATCEQKDSAHKIIEAGLRKQNESLKALVPGKVERFITATKWTAIGVVIGAALQHR